MKILSLSCENINSLKGKVSKIDLASGILADTGLFVISGPTGAGKSTLLDVICVALYGKTPRLDVQTDHLMSKTSGYCWAEVEFEVAQTHYRSRWELHRSRKKVSGAMQGSKMFLSRLDKNGEGEIIEEKTSRVPPMIQELTGLDFQRFCRSMLLAQGEFDAFLKGKDNERAELLEKMTGTEVYRDISIQVFETCKQAKKTWESQMDWQAQHLKTKTSRPLKELEEALQKAQTEMTHLKNKLETILNQIRQWHQYQEYLKHSESLRVRQLEWNDAEQSDQRQQWKRWLKIEPLEVALTQLKNKQDDLDLKQREVKESEEEQAQLKERLNKLLKVIMEQSENLAEVEREKKKLDRLYPQFIELTNEASHCSQQIVQLKDQLGELKRQQSEKKQQLKEVEIKCDSLQLKLNQLEEKFSRIGPVALQKKMLSDLEHDLMTLKELTRQSEQLETEWFRLVEQSKELELEHEQTKETWVELSDSLNTLKEHSKDFKAQEKSMLSKLPNNWDASQTEDQLQQIQNILSLENQLEQAQLRSKAAGEEIAQSQQFLVQLNDQYSQMQIKLSEMEEKEQQQFWAKHRAQLESGEPCPLCGSKDHPHASSHSLEDVSGSNLSRLKQEKEGLQTKVIQEQERFKSQTEQVEVFQKDLLKQKQTLEGALKVSGLEQCSIDERTFQLQNIKTALKIDQELSMLRAKYLELQSSQIKAQTALNEQQTEQQAFVQKKIEMEASLKATTNQREILQSETKKTKKAIFEKLLALELNFELDESLNEKLKNYLQQLEEQEKEMLFSQKVILELQNNKIQWEATSRELGKQDKQVRQRLQEMTEVQQDLQKKKRDLHPEADQFLEIYRDTQKDCEQKKQAFGNLEKQKLELEFKSNQLQESLQKNKRQMPSQIEEFKHVIEAFKTSLQKQGFEDQEEVEQLFAMKENCLKLKVWNEQHESREREIEIAQAQLLERKLETPEKDQKICESEHLQLQEQLESLQKTMGALQREKEQELQWLKQFQDQIESSQKAEKDYLEWEQLRRLIGSADGSAFRRIAQRITLKFLLKLANRHLKTILERYQLVEESDREMGIILKDRYQAMSSRPMETLSGGERFMISLALALALSDISRRHQSIESLFIDEGFGALDVHALDRVLESLDKIRQMGRTIGIISHIEALKERIPVQIQVHPLQGGSSAVKVVGAI